MQSITLHPRSLLAGAAIASLAWFTTSAQFSSPVVSRVVVEQRIAGIPTADQMVRIEQAGGPFTVPAGKILVITGLGAIGDHGDSNLVIDGVLVAEANTDTPGGAGSSSTPSIRALPAGLTATAGQDVTVSAGGSGGIVLGYLVDE